MDQQPVQNVSNPNVMGAGSVFAGQNRGGFMARGQRASVSPLLSKRIRWYPQKADPTGLSAEQTKALIDSGVAPDSATYDIMVKKFLAQNQGNKRRQRLKRRLQAAKTVADEISGKRPNLRQSAQAQFLADFNSGQIQTQLKNELIKDPYLKAIVNSVQQNTVKNKGQWQKVFENIVQMSNIRPSANRVVYTPQLMANVVQKYGNLTLRNQYTGGPLVGMGKALQNTKKSIQNMTNRGKMFSQVTDPDSEVWKKLESQKLATFKDGKWQNLSTIKPLDMSKRKYDPKKTDFIMSTQLTKKKMETYLTPAMKQMNTVVNDMGYGTAGPIKVGGVPLFIGRWVDQMGRIRIFPKAAATYDPLSWNQKMDYLLYRMVNKWNTYAQSQQQVLNHLAKQENWDKIKTKMTKNNQVNVRAQKQLTSLVKQLYKPKPITMTPFDVLKWDKRDYILAQAATPEQGYLNIAQLFKEKANETLARSANQMTPGQMMSLQAMKNWGNQPLVTSNKNKMLVQTYSSNANAPYPKQTLQQIKVNAQNAVFTPSLRQISLDRIQKKWGWRGPRDVKMKKLNQGLQRFAGRRASLTYLQKSNPVAYQFMTNLLQFVQATTLQGSFGAVQNMDGLQQTEQKFKELLSRNPQILVNTNISAVKVMRKLKELKQLATSALISNQPNVIPNSQQYSAQKNDKLKKVANDFTQLKVIEEAAASGKTVQQTKQVIKQLQKDIYGQLSSNIKDRLRKNIITKSRDMTFMGAPPQAVLQQVIPKQQVMNERAMQIDKRQNVTQPDRELNDVVF